MRGSYSKDVLCRHYAGRVWLVETFRYPAGYKVASVQEMMDVLCNDSLAVGREEVKKTINDALRPRLFP